MVPGESLRSCPRGSLCRVVRSGARDELRLYEPVVVVWQDEIGVLASHCFFYLFLAQWSMWRRGQCVRLCWYAYQFRKIKVTAAVDVVQETQSRTQHVFEMFQCGIEVHSTIIVLLIALFAFFED